MIGFLIGAVCLIGLIKTARFGRGYRDHGGWRGHDHRGGSCAHTRDERGGYGRGPRAAIRILFERLDTSPGQERVIMAAVEQLWTKKRELGDEVAASRHDVARAMRGERFDEAALGEAFTRQDALFAQLRESVGTTMKTIHEALDERQRKIAADALEGGRFGRGGGPFGGGPYRNAWS